MSFTASSGNLSTGIGERLDTDGGVADVVLTVRHGVPHGVVGIHTDAGEMHRAVLPDVGSGVVRWRTRGDETSFVRVEVRHPHGAMAALTNPILLA